MLAPDGSGVLYLAQGAAWVTPLIRMPKDAFLQARRTAYRMAALSNAKQVGLALQMYAQDYDEVYPPADGPVIDRLKPYARSEAVFNDPSTGATGFVYLHPQATLKEIGEPAKTRIGHLTGPGGRAIIFADGHVEWEDD
jgi:prepilin-type processing-associated H-X9-DG protein